MKTLNNNIEETRVSFENAKLLKEAGFNIFCDALYYDSNGNEWNGFSSNSQDYLDKYNKPTQQLAIDWIRLNFGIHVWIEFIPTNRYIYRIRDDKQAAFGENKIDLESTLFKTPEEAKESAIKYVLENLI